MGFGKGDIFCLYREYVLALARVKYGPKKVIDTLIAENSIVGTATVIALMCLRPLRSE